MLIYEDILATMREEYHSHTGFYADDASDIGVRLKVLASQLFSLNHRVESLKTQVFPQTATGLELDHHAATRGLTRKEAAAAAGVLRFTRESAAPMDILIPEGVVCAGSADSNLRFVTTALGLIPAGSTFAELPARAQSGGSGSNIAPNIIDVMITPVQSVSGVCNPAAFTGGADSETDDQLRARLLSSFATISNGTNASFYYDFVMGFEGVASANVVPRANGRGTVGVYLAGAGAALPETLLREIGAKLTQAKEINVDVTVANARLTPVNLTLEINGNSGVDFENLQTECKNSIKTFFAGLLVGQNLLLSGISNALYRTQGLYNYKLVAPAQDRGADENELFVVGDITISRMVVII